MEGIIIVLTLITAFISAFAIMSEDEGIRTFLVIIAMSIAIGLGVQIEKYNNLESKKYEQIFKKQG